MVSYLLALNAHGPWDNWMGVFFFIALADFLTSLVELGVRAINLVLSAMAS